jgi:hypothetical protein
MAEELASAQNRPPEERGTAGEESARGETQPLLPLASASITIRRRPLRSPWRLVLSGLLVGLLLLASIGLLVTLTTSQAYTLLHGQATANARATLMIRSTATALAQGTAQALATQQAAINATATAQGLATAQSTALAATATTLTKRLEQITQGQPVLNDTLADNSGQHGWEEGQHSDGTGCFFADGTYHVVVGAPGFLQPCIAHATNFDNFVYEVQLTIVRGEQAGLLFRVSSDQQSYYLFRIGIDGSFALDLYQRSGATTLLSGFSPAITTGLTQSNTLDVLATQQTIALYVNQQNVGSVSETTLSAGAIGVVALDYGLPCTAEFSNARVWSIP